MVNHIYEKKWTHSVILVCVPYYMYPYCILYCTFMLWSLWFWIEYIYFHMAAFGPLWSHVWSSMALFCPVCSHMAWYGPVWPSMFPNKASYVCLCLTHAFFALLCLLYLVSKKLHNHSEIFHIWRLWREITGSMKNTLKLIGTSVRHSSGRRSGGQLLAMT